MDESYLRPIEGSFDASLFQPRYQRNNKRGGLKNLRCFPTCAAQHKERGFCGRPVFMKLKSDEGDNLLTWAEFVKSDEPKSINVGHMVSLSQAETLSRSKDEPLKPWIRGALASCGSGITTFEFNREKRGWHYGWASNKHTCNASHVLVAWIFERSRTDPDRLVCRGVIESPPFMLFCRRRRRFTLVPSAPIAEPKSAKNRTKSGDDEDFDEDDDEDEEEEEEEVEEPEPKRPAGRRKNSTSAASTTKSAAPKSSSKRTKLEVIDFPEWPIENGLGTGAFGNDTFASTSTTLDKNRVDALLSLLHLAWRKIKDSDHFTGTVDAILGDDHTLAQPSSNSGGGNHSSSANTSSSNKDNSTSIAAQSDSEFYQMLEFLSGDFELDGLTLDVAGGGGGDGEEQYEVDPDVEALAEYLLKEPDFRQSVLWLRGKGGHPDFNAFIGILRDQIHKFMRTRLWTVADIDRLIQSSSLSQPNHKLEVSSPWSANGDFANWEPASAASGRSSPREFAVDSYTVPNITGVWKQTKESQTTMEQIREKSGSSWVMSKLFEFMESKFTIQQNGLELSCRLWPMPALRFVLDGEEHPWGIRLPLFQPNWTYRAWTDGKVITLQHQIENRRLTRKYWCDPYRRFLYSEATLEVYDAYAAKFIEESRVTQTAERVR